MTEHAFPLDPDAIVPFHAYRCPGLPRIVELAPSLAHFYESEKFRTGDEADEELRRTVLASPTAKAARKLAKRHITRWRSDWRTVRGRVFRAGLSMQAAQSPQVMQALKAIADEALLWSSDSSRRGGLPVSGMAREIATLLHGRQDGATPRVGMLALDGYTPPDLVARLDALFAGERPHGVAYFVGESSSVAAEDWAAQVAAPLRFVGDPAQRLRASECTELLKRINLLVVCAPSTRKEVRELVKAAKAKKIAIRDLTFQPASATR